MKIIIAISHSFCSNFIKGQAAFLKDQGHEVIIISAPGPEVENVAKNEGARLITLPIQREIDILSDLRLLFKIRRIIKKEKPDIINAGNPKTGFLFSLQKLLYIKTPIIFTLRGLRSDTLEGLKRKIVTATEKISCSLSNEVIVISPSLKTHATNRKILSKDKGIVILEGSSNGIMLQRFTPREVTVEKAQILRNSWGFKSTDVIVGFIGRVTKDKGVRELYESFLLAQKKIANLKLVLTGPTEEDDAIDKFLLDKMEHDENIRLLGNQSDIPAILMAYDMLVLYSYREGFGNVALEASAMEIPIIVSDIPGARDTIIDRKTGLLIPPKDINALQEGLVKLASDESLRSQYGKNGRKRVLRSFDSYKIWQGQLDIYSKMIEK